MGYPKIWTSIMDEDWWELANGMQRGCYLQMLLLCKDGADDGQLCYKNVSKLPILLGIDRRTMGRVLTFLSQNGCINVTYEDNGLLRIFIPNYKLYQGFDAKSHRKHIVGKRGDSGTKKPPTVNSKPDSKQSTVNLSAAVKKPPKKTNPDHKLVVDYFCQAYQDKVGAAYAFHGKEDGGKITTLLSRWTLQQIKYLIDTMFSSTDEFYRTGGGYSIGVLLANDNKLVQEAKRRVEGTDGLSKVAAKNAETIKKVLQEMECQQNPKLSQK